jgi:hypothetical protein
MVRGRAQVSRFLHTMKLLLGTIRHKCEAPISAYYNVGLKGQGHDITMGLE